MWVVTYASDVPGASAFVVLVPRHKARTPGEALTAAEAYADEHHGGGMRRHEYTCPATVVLTHYVV